MVCPESVRDRLCLRSARFSPRRFGGALRARSPRYCSSPGRLMCEADSSCAGSEELRGWRHANCSSASKERGASHSSLRGLDRLPTRRTAYMMYRPKIRSRLRMRSTIRLEGDERRSSRLRWCFRPAERRPPRIRRRSRVRSIPSCTRGIL